MHFLPPRLARATALTAALAAVSACGDQATDLESLLDSAEAEAVVRSAETLPTLPGLIDAVIDDVDPGTRGRLFRAREEWTRGGIGSGPRETAAMIAAPALADVMPAAEWERVRRDLDAWARAADGMMRHLPIPWVQESLDRGRRELMAADRATAPDDRAFRLLRASAFLWETSPRYVAGRLADEADRAYADRVGDAGPDERERLERAERLKNWALRAVEDEDYLLAIQRAYYALQLLEGR